jgi:Fe-S-cluster containining protein
MQCRGGCGACCIAPSISSAIPGMPAGKAAGQRCSQLDEMNRCLLFGQPERPAVCLNLMPSVAMCGDDREQALLMLSDLEVATLPLNNSAKEIL